MNPKYIMKAIEYARSGKFSMFVNPELTKEIMARIGAPKDASVLVLFSYEMLPVLYELGYSNVTLVFDKPRTSIYNIAEQYGYNVVTFEELGNMKFDVVTGNPPFSKTNEGKTAGKKAKNLYPDFYALSVEIAERVAMIMPNTSTQQLSHNHLLKKTAHSIIPVSDEVQAQMGVGIKMWIAFHDKKKKADVNHLFVDRSKPKNNIAFMKGKLNLSGIDQSEKKTARYSHEVIKGMYVSGPEKVYIKPNGAHKKLPVGKYAVLLPLTLQANGWSSTKVMRTNGQSINVNVTYVLCDTKEEAEKIHKKVTSRKFIKQAHELKGNQGVMTVQNLKMINVE